MINTIIKYRILTDLVDRVVTLDTISILTKMLEIERENKLKQRSSRGLCYDLDEAVLNEVSIIEQNSIIIIMKESNTLLEPLKYIAENKSRYIPDTIYWFDRGDITSRIECIEELLKELNSDN